MNNSFNIGTFNAGNAAVNQGGTIHGDQIGTQNQYTNDPEVQGAIASPALPITLSTKSASKTATFAKAKVAATASSTKA